MHWSLVLGAVCFTAVSPEARSFRRIEGIAYRLAWPLGHDIRLESQAYCR
jgi:hypothetical protein